MMSQNNNLDGVLLVMQMGWDLFVMHSHHSHSGQFCQHARNTLEEMVLRAIELKFSTFCLSEHMPRIEDIHLYPEELESKTTLADLAKSFDSYFDEARRLQQVYADKIDILVGFECEGINHEYLKQVEILLQTHKPDYFVGSLHHSDDTPIDFDKKTFELALAETANNSVDRLVLNYFIQLHGLIARLRPPVIAHYDLIRLFAPDYDLKNSRAWPHVVRTIQLAVRSDCLFEINSSAIRKGWDTPYPQRDIAEKIIELGGKFCLSDDSHSIEQVGLNYDKVIQYLDSLGVAEVWKLKLTNKIVRHVSVPLDKIKEWQNQLA